LLGDQGVPIWLTGVIENALQPLMSHFDQIQWDMRGCRTFQNEVDFRASHPRRAVEKHTRVISILLVVSYGEHVGDNRLLTFGPKSEERHRVTVYTHCEVV